MAKNFSYYCVSTWAKEKDRGAPAYIKILSVCVCLMIQTAWGYRAVIKKVCFTEGTDIKIRGACNVEMFHSIIAPLVAKEQREQR